MKDTTAMGMYLQSSEARTCTGPGLGRKDPLALTIARLEAVGHRHEVTSLGCKTVWRRFGEGPPLVLLHGGHGSWLHWIRNIEALSGQHTLWLPDMPGYGESGSLDVEHQADNRLQQLVATLVAALGSLLGSDTPVDMAGFSFGGFIAAHVAVQRPVRRLALIGPSGHGGPRRQTTALADWRHLKAPERRSVLRDNLATLMLHDAHAIDDVVLAMYEAQCQATRFHSRSLSRSGGLPQALEAFTGPLMFVWGEHDVTATPDFLEPCLKGARPHLGWHVIEGAGHWAQFEHSEQVNPVLKDWFKRL